MSMVKYVKSFSKGQITIPKELRDRFGLGDDFWLRLSVDEDRLIAEPVDYGSVKPENYLNDILNIKGDWLSLKELKDTRKAVEKRLSNNDL